MEYYRRLGFAEKVRVHGLPPDYPTDIAYFTRYPTRDGAAALAVGAGCPRDDQDICRARGARPNCRTACSQMYIEQVLRDEARRTNPCRSAPAGGSRVHRHGDRVEVEAESADGRPSESRRRNTRRRRRAAQPVRRRSICITTATAWCAPSWAGGSSPSISARQRLRRHAASARLEYWAVNHARAPSWRRSTAATSSPSTPNRRATRTEANFGRRKHRAMFRDDGGAGFDIEIIARHPGHAGYTLVAEKFQRGRIFLGGDAVHLFTPAGGLGYNTAVEDAVNLGWKLAAVLKAGAARACSTATKPSGRPSPCATPPMPAVSPTRSACSCRRPSWRTTPPPAKRRAS